MEILKALHIESIEKLGRYIIPEDNFFLVLDMPSTFPSGNEKENEDAAMRFFFIEFIFRCFLNLR